MNDFLEFCKNNRSLIALAGFLAFISFSAKLFLFTVGIDTDAFIADKTEIHNIWIGVGRWGLVLLQNFRQVYDPLYSTLIGLVFLVFSVLSWAFLISYFDPKKDKNTPLYAFGAVAVTSPIWAEFLHFSLMSAEIFLGIFIAPFAVIALFEGFAQKSKKKIGVAVLLMTFLTCVYQSFSVLFVFGFAIGILFMSQRKDFDKKLPLKIFIALSVSLIIYQIAGELSIRLFSIERLEYQSRMILWDFATIKNALLNIFGFVYILTFAKIEPLHNLITAVFLDGRQGSYTVSTGMSVGDRIFELSTVFGSVVLLPLTAVFFVYVFRERKQINKFFYFSAAIIIPLSILLLAIFLANKPPLRSLFMLPFVFGFLFYFVISRSKTKIAVQLFTVLAFAVSLHFSQISSALFYSDSERFRQDVFFASQIDFKIREIAGNQSEGSAIAFIGKRESLKSSSFLRGEVLGFSQFEFGANGFFESSFSAIYFMQSLGMNYELPDSAQMIKARKAGEEMPVFPQNSSIRIVEGDDGIEFIIVKISQSVYRE